MVAKRLRRSKKEFCTQCWQDVAVSTGRCSQELQGVRSGQTCLRVPQTGPHSKVDLGTVGLQLRECTVYTVYNRHGGM